MNTVLILVELVCAAVILFRVICIASRLNRKEWTGHPLQFFGLSISYPLVSGGAVGALFGWKPALLLLLVGMAGLVLSDRRIGFHRGDR